MASLVLILGGIVLLCGLQLLKTRYRTHLSSIPGPWIASFTNLWKVAAIYDGDMPGWNAAAHDKHGSVVRIGPNHVSFASPEAFQTIYNSRQAFDKTPRQGFDKTDFYEVGAPVYHGEPLENLFSLRDPHRHAMMRRSIGGLYTKVAVKGFESGVDNCIQLFLERMKEKTSQNNARLDMSLWLHLFAFDCLGEINVSKRLGFLDHGRDVDGIIKFSDTIFYLVGLLTQAPFLHQVLNFLRGLQPAEKAEPVLKLTLEELEARKSSSQSKDDMMNQFLGLHQKAPEKVTMHDLTAAIFINLTAGHDVLAITLRAIWYFLGRNPHVMAKLREELDAASEDILPSDLVPWETVSSLPYLAVIHESLRIHPNTGTILERKVPPKGAVIDGVFVPEGTTVGVNAWILHRNNEVFGEDPEVFRPERWLEAGEKKKFEMMRHLFSFGAGAHTCIGKNIAMMIMSKLAVEFYRRYDAKLATPEQEWEVHGSWVTKQTEMDMLISRL